MPIEFEPFQVHPDKVEYFRTNGHVCLAGVAEPDCVAQYRIAINEATTQYGGSDLPLRNVTHMAKRSNNI